MSSLNCLKGLSFDRTAQTSFWQKLVDTFCVFFGDLNLRNDPKNETKEHCGIFDYLTLTVSYWFEWPRAKLQTGLSYSLFLFFFMPHSLSYAFFFLLH